MFHVGANTLIQTRNKYTYFLQLYYYTMLTSYDTSFLTWSSSASFFMGNTLIIKIGIPIWAAVRSAARQLIIFQRCACFAEHTIFKLLNLQQQLLGVIIERFVFRLQLPILIDVPFQRTLRRRWYVRKVRRSTVHHSVHARQTSCMMLFQGGKCTATRWHWPRNAFQWSGNVIRRSGGVGGVDQAGPTATALCLLMLRRLLVLVV